MCALTDAVAGEDGKVTRQSFVAIMIDEKRVDLSGAELERIWTRAFGHTSNRALDFDEWVGGVGKVGTAVRSP